MPYEQSSSSLFYRSNSGEATNGYGGFGFGESSAGSTRGHYSNFESASRAGYGTGAGDAFLNGGNGNVFHNGSDSNSFLNGSDDNSFLNGSNNEAFLKSGNANTFLNGSSSEPYLNGGNVNSFLNGSHSEPFLNDANVNSFLNGSSSEPFLNGGHGNSFLNGSHSEPFLNGNNDEGFLSGSNSNSFLNGTNNETFLNGGNGNSFVNGNNGNSYLHGTNSELFTNGTNGNTFLNGSSSEPFLNGRNSSSRSEFHPSSLQNGVDQQAFSGAPFANGSEYGTGNFEQQSSSLSKTLTDSPDLYQDPNPQVVRRPPIAGPQTYTQRVIVKFLQPPPMAPPGPLIIKEVRLPQPPPPPPLFIRQRPPPPPVLPPLIIREAPPKIPPTLGPQVITRMLPPLPVPPRSVIIERLPPLPPKPRDVIVERWLPYRSQQKRRVIIQRAPPAVIPKPRNIIIYYEPAKAQIVRRFQNLGITIANPDEYVARYGAQLEDSQTLVSHARQAGVVEDISPPTTLSSGFQSPNYDNYESSDTGVSTAGYDLSDGLSAVGGTRYVPTNGGVGGMSSNGYESPSTYNTLGRTSGFTGDLDSSYNALGFPDNTNGFGGGSNNYESYSSQPIYT